MGLTQKLGTIPLAILTDSSNNVGIGAAASGSYKLQVTGTTNLTGALSGTTASFSVNVGNSNTGLDLTNSGALGYGNSINFYQNATKAVQIFTESSAANTSEIEFRTLVGGTLAKRFKIESTGAATFSSRVTVGDAVGSSPLVWARSGGATGYLYSDSDNVGITNVLDFGAGYEGILLNSSTSAINFYTNGVSTPRLAIASTGAATFASTIAATGATFTGTASSVLNVRSTSSSAYSTTDYYNSANEQMSSFGYANASVAVTAIQNSSYIYTAPDINFVILTGGANDRFRISASTGAVVISGSLSKGSGSFKIDHPIESMNETHHLVHSFVESPQANNIYRGKVQLENGIAKVNLDQVSTMTEGTFILLNREIHTYTTNETDWDAVRGKVEDNILIIECQNNHSSAIVSWLVIGERQDKHMMDTEWTDNNGRVIVEPLKEIKEETENK